MSYLVVQRRDSLRYCHHLSAPHPDTKSRILMWTWIPHWENLATQLARIYGAEGCKFLRNWHRYATGNYQTYCETWVRTWEESRNRWDCRRKRRSQEGFSTTTEGEYSKQCRITSAPAQWLELSFSYVKRKKKKKKDGMSPNIGFSDKKNAFLAN